MFPHHECEIAQNVASRGTAGVHYWVHNNMITINGQKMGKSLGNFITLPQLFSGEHPKLEQAYSPMTVRFFILQAHYRGTLDFGNEALQAASKALRRLMAAARDLYAMAGRKAPDYAYGEFPDSVAPDSCNADSAEIRKIFDGVYEALCDDLNTPVALSHLFDAVRLINSAKEGKVKFTAADLDCLCRLFDDIVFAVLGLRDEENAGGGRAMETIEGLMDMVLEARAEAREQAKLTKDWSKCDRIRDALKAIGIQVKDGKDGASWSLE